MTSPARESCMTRYDERCKKRHIPKEYFVVPPQDIILYHSK